MSCVRALHWLQLYIDERLDPRLLQKLEMHVSVCANCRHELVMLEQIAASLHARVLAEPADLHDRVMRRVAEAEVRRAAARTIRFAVHWSDGLLAALLATISTFVFVLMDAQLRVAVPMELARAFPGVANVLAAGSPGSTSLLAWIIWTVSGTALALWLAGPEVRITWRDELVSHLPALPSLRDM